MIAPVNRIIDSSLVDGPGNRTSIFFQGCSFNCLYCHNPETIHMCRNCLSCVPLCPTGALRAEDSKVCFDPALCQECDTCIKHCPHQASPRIRWMTVEEVEAHVLQNMPFIRGVTCSGGECTCQADFICALFTKLQKHGLHCLLDSNGGVLDFEQTGDLMSVTDGVMLDIKCMEPFLHEQLTGVSNDLVLKNARYLASVDKLPEIRTVMTAQLLRNEETVREAARLLEPYLSTSSIRYRLIAFRSYGVREEFRYLGTPAPEEMERLKQIALDCGFRDVIIT